MEAVITKREVGDFGGVRDKDDDVKLRLKANVKYKLLHPDAKAPWRAYRDDAGADLHSIEEHYLHAGDSCVVRTGVATLVPKGYYGQICSRSGHGMNYKVTLSNSIGVLDSGYSAEILILLTNQSKDKTLHIKVGDRIAQIIILPLPEVTFELVDEFEFTDRGENGFGSSKV